MDREEWRPFLKRWSEEWISAHDPDRDGSLDPDVVRGGWLGFAPAASADVAALERRLALTLPPSLRAFLEVTDGWRDAGLFIYRLGGTSEIGRPEPEPPRRCRVDLRGPLLRGRAAAADVRLA